MTIAALSRPQLERDSRRDLSLLITTRTRNGLSPDINNTAIRLMRGELNAIVGQLQGQVNELNAPLSAPAFTPTGSVTPVCLVAMLLI
jgi:hypothetical protein